MARQWTAEERERQRSLIQTWEPWKRSTGAITPEGKQKSSMNSLKHGKYTKQQRQAKDGLQQLLKLAKKIRKNSDEQSQNELLSAIQDIERWIQLDSSN